MADRIEAGTFCVAATLSKGTLEINNLDPKIISTELNLLKKTGAKINKNFAKSQIPEFKIYWLETKEMRNCWNSKFIQHVKFKWNTKNGSSKNVLSRLKDYEWAVNFKN